MKYKYYYMTSTYVNICLQKLSVQTIFAIVVKLVILTLTDAQIEWLVFMIRFAILCQNFRKIRVKTVLNPEMPPN